MSDWCIVCPTRGRADTIEGRTAKFFPNIIYVMGPEDKPKYIEQAGMSENQIMVVQSKGITNVMAEVMERRKERTIVRIDDDLKSVSSVVGQRQRKYTEEEDLLAIIENSMEISRDLGLSLFHWGFSRNPMYYAPFSPFGLFSESAAQIYGINDRKIVYDTRLKTREDLDVSLQAYRDDRVAFRDMRFIFQFTQVFEGTGGLQLTRDDETRAKDTELMLRKWAPFIEIDDSTDMVRIKFKRTNERANVK